MRARLEVLAPGGATWELSDRQSWVVLVDRGITASFCRKIDFQSGLRDHWFRLQSLRGVWHVFHEGGPPFARGRNGVEPGTSVNGTRINTPTPLEHGDEITSSGETFVFSHQKSGSALVHPKLPGGALPLRAEEPVVLGRASPSVVSFLNGYDEAAHLVWARGALTLRAGGARHVELNGVDFSGERRLANNDVLSFLGVDFRFTLELSARETAAEESLRLHLDADPTDESSWQVYGDLLLEHGDPLGEYLAEVLRGRPVDVKPWLGALAPWVAERKLELEWDHGFIRAARFRGPRQPSDRLERIVERSKPVDWLPPVKQLLKLPLSRLLRSLTVNLPAFAKDHHFSSRRRNAAAGSAAAGAYGLAGQLPLPRTLRELCLGYVVAERSTTRTLRAAAKRGQRAPGFATRPLFTVKKTATVRVVQLEPGITCDRREFTLSGSQWRGLQFTKHSLVITDLLEPMDTGFLVNGQVWLQPGKHLARLRVNGKGLPSELDVTEHRADTAPDKNGYEWERSFPEVPNRWGFPLLPGDLIELTSVGQLRFE